MLPDHTPLRPPPDDPDRVEAETVDSPQSDGFSHISDIADTPDLSGLAFHYSDLEESIASGVLDVDELGSFTDLTGLSVCRYVYEPTGEKVQVACGRLNCKMHALRRASKPNFVAPPGFYHPWPKGGLVHGWLDFPGLSGNHYLAALKIRDARKPSASKTTNLAGTPAVTGPTNKANVRFSSGPAAPRARKFGADFQAACLLRTSDGVPDIMMGIAEIRRSLSRKTHTLVQECSIDEARLWYARVIEKRDLEAFASSRTRSKVARQKGPPKATTPPRKDRARGGAAKPKAASPTKRSTTPIKVWSGLWKKADHDDRKITANQKRLIELLKRGYEEHIQFEDQDDAEWWCEQLSAESEGQDDEEDVDEDWDGSEEVPSDHDNTGSEDEDPTSDPDDVYDEEEDEPSDSRRRPGRRHSGNKGDPPEDPSSEDDDSDADSDDRSDNGESSEDEEDEGRTTRTSSRRLTKIRPKVISKTGRRNNKVTQRGFVSSTTRKLSTRRPSHSKDGASRSRTIVRPSQGRKSSKKRDADSDSSFDVHNTRKPDPSVKNSDLVYGMRTISERLEKALCPSELCGKDRKRLVENALDVTQLPGTFTTLLDDEPGVDTIGQVTEAATSMLSSITGKQRQLQDSQWKLPKKNAMTRIKSKEDLERMIEDVYESETPAFQDQDDRLRSFLTRRHYTEEEADEYLQCGLLPHLVRQTFRMYVRLLEYIRKICYKHGGIWQGLCVALTEHHTRGLGKIRTFCSDYKALVVRSYVYLRDATESKFMHPSVHEGLWEKAITLPSPSGSTGQGTGSTQLVCPHCRSKWLHGQMGVAHTRQVCPLTEVSGIKAKAGIAILVAERREHPTVPLATAVSNYISANT